jgi:dethiobiotin synthetase/adenosylmethionine--8-amino-7-oxononanoate aminotransferase
MSLITPPARALLWRSLRAYQVYGANTEVGKTVVTTTLCKAASRLWGGEDEGIVYLKPVSTGPADAADDRCELSPVVLCLASCQDCHPSLGSVGANPDLRCFATQMICAFSLLQYELGTATGIIGTLTPRPQDTFASLRPRSPVRRSFSMTLPSALTLQPRHRTR